MLTALAAKPSWGVAELAGQLDMDISTATRNLRPLATAGYITMRAGARDARRREIRISAKGSRALVRGRSLWRKAQRETVATLGEPRLVELLAMLGAMA
jgi:DNA-binding MarR family transcriptional regulator